MNVAYTRIVCKYGGVEKIKQDMAEQLRAAGLRATPARAAVLKLLISRAKPMEAQEILQLIPAGMADTATVYRILHSLTQAGLARAVQLRAGAVSYEAAGLPHHHHVICEKCGLVEDVTACCDNPKPIAIGFQKVTGHTLEFSGICKACAK